MGTAQIQATFWGARTDDYATIVEPFTRPVYERVFDQTRVQMGTKLLDVGCGPGLAAQIAAQRGAQVAGLDAAETSLIIARQRTPDGDFRVGDMEELPWPDAAFDVVTSFNGFQYAADPVNALREARRVVKPGGRVVVMVWGRAEDNEARFTIMAVSKLLPPPPPGAGGPFALGEPGRLEDLLEKAGLVPLSGGEVAAPFEFPDLETGIRGHMSAGPNVAAAQRVGDDAVRQAISESLAAFRMSDGRYIQRNKFRYVIAGA